MPNMTWIFSSTGIHVYKFDCTDARSVENAGEYFVEVLERRRANA